MLNSQNVAEKIKNQAKAQGITVKKLLEDCGLGVNTVGKMAKGTDITSQNLCKIADYLDVSLDYLYGRDTKNNAPENDLRGAIIEKLNQLSDSQLDRLLGYLEALLSE